MPVEMAMEEGTWELARYVAELSVGIDSAIHEVPERALLSAKIIETYRKASKRSREDREER